MSHSIKVNSFFAGIGGFDLAFEKMGFKIKFQCEINDFCTSILNKHWPELKVEKDITKIDPDILPDADIWCGGFPCQDVSVARGAIGRDGLNGKNSGLFYNFFELISSKRPEVILIENVTGLLNSHDGNDFKIVIQSLTSIGYGVSWRVFNTRYFGTPQSRPRVFICAWRNNLEKAIYALHETEPSVKVIDQRSGFLTPKTVSGTDITVPEIAYCLAATSGRHTGTDWSRTYISYFDKVRRLTPEESEKLQGFPSGWTIPDNFKGNKRDKDLDSLRYHAIGNAVSVPVVVWIANRIKAIQRKRTVNKGIKWISSKYGDFSEGTARKQFFSQLNSKVLFENNKVNKIRWRSGGLAFGDEIVDCSAQPCPTLAYSSYLSDIVETNMPDAKYFISSGAARGILRRVEDQNRVLFSPLMKALQKLSKQSSEQINV